MVGNGNITPGTAVAIRPNTRKILWWKTECWTRVIALMSMVQHSVSLFIAVHEIIVLVSRLEYFNWEFLVFLAIGLIVSSVGVFTAVILLVGVERKFSSSLKSWIISSCVIMSIILITATACFYSIDAKRNAWFLLSGACVLFILHLPCIWIVNSHRKEIDKQKIQRLVQMELHKRRRDNGLVDLPLYAPASSEPTPHCSYGFTQKPG